jgi:hypothetical protein
VSTVNATRPEMQERLIDATAEKLPSRDSYWFLPGFIILETLLVAAFASIHGPSTLLARAYGMALLITFAWPLAVSLLRRPEELVRPVNLMSVACIYLLLADLAIPRDVEEFPASAILATDVTVALFLCVVISTWCFVKFRANRLGALLRTKNLSGNGYFWAALISFSALYIARLYLVRGNLGEMLTQMLMSSREQSIFHNSPEGDYRSFLKPIEYLFLGVCFFAERAWYYGVSPFRKWFLVLLAGLQLLTLVLEGQRGPVAESLLLPVFARAAQHHPGVRKQLRMLVLASFFLAPVFDTMVTVRGIGWEQYWRVSDTDVSWNPLTAQRDNNFHYVVALVDYLQEKGELLTYMGPLGFVSGLKSTWELWSICLIPRVWWPGKPLATKMGDETRDWFATDSIVGGLLRSGGPSFVLVGGILMGLWISLLEPLYYQRDKGDIGTIAYACIMVATIYMVRAIAPWNTVPHLAIAAAILVGWKLTVGVWKVPSRNKRRQRGYNPPASVWVWGEPEGVQ